ncbi:MAG: RNA polymerase subunit sigma-70 [Oscillospiraceae bacterium]|uniref:RNA polymerase subunit sigma-70 n=1 Tax=Clostridia TaxID=186801 RepID=UPI00232DC9EF|nr:RNA polymerase subunit sigma-70 [[Clostridium] symbiosum]MDB1973000.1 RNA polymerase subunit sigma-70 [[Clostridium] symbiosum]MDD7040380.1 RNA polymerase subunit sigma-70 [Oscillospiraceae bacterium]MDR4051708.1 RNA polymerase subunit sigma-70 [Oscillospiraceae bacterium]
MGFHYGMEKRKFDKEWEQLEQEYRAAGMTEEQIAAMWEYDWAWFCSQRIFGNRTQALPSEQYEDESEQSRLFQKFDSLSSRWDVGDIDHTRYGWMSAVEDEKLFHRLCKLSSEDLELLTLLFVDGYRQTDIAAMWGCSRNVIYKRLKKIKKILQQG